MSDFEFYFKLGWSHIITWGALDHQLFILALIAAYSFGQIKNVLVLVTAFTIGHSITLALTALDIIPVHGKWVEFLIPCTIVITAFTNFLTKNMGKKTININYYYALLFGLIHGMGFASNIKLILSKEQNFTVSLLSFNLGLEAGQIIVVITLLIVSLIATLLFKINKKDWSLFLSSCAFALALQMAILRFPL